MLFATSSCYEVGSFLPALRERYEKQGPKDDFEIVYLSLDCNENMSSFRKSIETMPWLVHAYAPDFAVLLAKQLFGDHLRLPAIAAFGPSGHLETKESNLALKEGRGDLKYPFIEASMDKEVEQELIHRYKWGWDNVLKIVF